ncbi:MAG TPA: hypothetical protein VMM37_09855 [Bacteroidota bacterium]|nr:hypothetical protein [Bacteroidota bacterium]
MKRAFVFVLLACVGGCNSNPVADSRFTTTFSIADTTGTPSTTFHPGESFDVSFAVTNRTGATQTYHFTGVPVVFQILQADSVLLTSVDGLVFPQVVLAGQLGDGETYTATWRAPNNAARVPTRELGVGGYQARVLHGCFFDHDALPPTSAIAFTVTQ